jgi:hypothetical protein
MPVRSYLHFIAVTSLVKNSAVSLLCLELTLSTLSGFNVKIFFSRGSKVFLFCSKLVLNNASNSFVFWHHYNQNVNIKKL